jgi:hypothetical protein
MAQSCMANQHGRGLDILPIKYSPVLTRSGAGHQNKSSIRQIRQFWYSRVHSRMPAEGRASRSSNFTRRKSPLLQVFKVCALFPGIALGPSLGDDMSMAMGKVRLKGRYGKKLRIRLDWPPSRYNLNSSSRARLRNHHACVPH